MTEHKRGMGLTAIESSVGSLKPSTARGACRQDAKAVIAHLTGSKLCKSGAILHITPADVDSPGDQLLIYAIQGGGYTAVDYHDVALMDDQIVVDLGRNPGNRVFLQDDYVSLLTRMQR